MLPDQTAPTQVCVSKVLFIFNDVMQPNNDIQF